MLGKAGRAETSTDPAPLSMMETVIVLKPHDAVAQGGHLVDSDWAPGWLKPSSGASRPTRSRPSNSWRR